MFPVIFYMLLSLLGAVYLYWTRKYNHWERRHMPHVPASFPFGNIKDIILLKRSISTFLGYLYTKFPGAKAVGFYALQEPMLMIKDPNLIKDILVKDFNAFADNGFVFYESVDPMMGLNPFTTRGPQWKVRRAIQSPIHTSRKIKLMVTDIVRCAQNYAKFISQQDGEVNISETCIFFTTNSVASSAFGLDSNSFFETSTIIENTKGQVFATSNAGPVAAFFAPWSIKIFKFRIVTKIAEDYFLELAKNLMAHRRNTNSIRNDLIQHLISVDDKAINEGNPPARNVDNAAQLMILFLDGSETSALSLSFTLFELAANEDIQEKLREELFEAGTSMGDLNYDNIWSLEYLDMVLLESLRLHPPVPLLSRICTEDYNLDGITIDKGTKVFIPSYALHKDPKHYLDPETFKPERFSKENRAEMNKYTFLPFGEGPRICMGVRYAQTEIKIAIITLILKYKLTLGSAHPTKKIIQDEKSSFIYVNQGDLWIKFTPL